MSTDVETADGGSLVRVNGIDLCVESFGDPGDPAILLIGGAASSMDWWDDAFCERLAAGERFVVRYDSRDTGRSTSYEAGAPPYSQADLVEDAVGLLDVFHLPDAHVVGISMGGGIAQRLAVEHPDRVATLTLISTRPGGPSDPDNPDDPDLPPMADKLEALFADPPTEPDWSDRDAVIDRIVDDQRPFAGSHRFDEQYLRELAGRIFDRTSNIAASMTNHWIIDGGQPIRSRLGEVSAATLVMHGTEDPLFPYGHGEALAAEIPGAELLPLPGVGHEMPPPQVWDIVVPALLRHTSGGWDGQADRLAAKSLAAGDPTGWFDRLYHAAACGEVAMPWDRTGPHALLAEWAQSRDISGEGRRALVVGCGLGADAAYVAGLGFDTVAFDVSDTAVQLARQRFADSGVEYVQADLLDLPRQWSDAFDLVVEIFTVQALPASIRRQAIANVGRMVAPGGMLLAIAAIHDDRDASVDGPPWPLGRSEIESFATEDLEPVRIEIAVHPDQPTEHRWRAEFRRAGVQR